MQVIKQKLTATCAQLTGYLHQPDTNAHQTNLPAIIIVPGGSYTHIPVAQAESRHGFRWARLPGLLLGIYATH